MTYSGNPALPGEVQQRILTTYRQSVQSAAQGNRDEALLGCDFILRLDPQFGPARVLQQMIGAGRPPADFAPLLGEGAAAAGQPDLRTSFAELIEARRFAEVLNAAERDKRVVAADPELQRLVELAQSRYEAEPYLLKFLEAADIAQQNGDPAEAERLLGKARALDPSHPRLAGGPDAAPPASLAPPSGSLELSDLDFGFPLPDAAEAGLEPAPALAPPAPAAATEESSGRIATLLDEGQAAFDRQEYQSAIDAWSRIFLIDIDHEEAARKIERARQLKAEREREVEEIFHDGIARFDAGELPAARAAFTRVLELNPGYALAREYLDKLGEREAGGEGTPGGLPELAPVGAAPAAPPRPARGASGELKPPAPEPAREGRRRAVGSGYAATAKRRASGPSPRFLLVGGAVLAVLAAGGWFLFQQRDRLFPNSSPPSTPAPAAQIDAVTRAQKLHEEGKTALAVAQLRRIPPQDARYAEAQSLISQWEKLAAADEPAVDPRQAARRRELLEGAQQALVAGENFLARRRFEQAAELAPLEGDWVAMAAAAEERLQPLAVELQLFEDGDYEYLVNQLWRRREADPANQDLARLLTVAYYDLGVLDLQRGDPAAAREKFREARAIDGNDPMLQRLERFAATYEKKSQDLLYRIFVKYLPMR